MNVRGLFLRIFVAFWVAMTLAGVGFALVVSAEPESAERQRRHAFFTETIRIRGERSLEAVREGRSDDVRAELLELAARAHVRTYLVMPGREPIGPDAISPELRALAGQAAREHRSIEQPNESGAHFVAAVPVDGGVIVTAFPPPPSRVRFLLGSPTTLPARLGVVFLAVGLVAYGLARYLTRPIGHLRTAAQRLASGDLTARVSPSVVGTTEEITALGHDFDRMAERIEALIAGQERLLRDVSHELRSPLARLTLALEIARTRTGGVASAELDRIEREAMRLGELVGHILTLARLADDVPLAEEDVDLATLVESIIEDVDYEARSRGRRIELAPPAQVHVLGQAEALRWAIENVLRNAVAFTDDGSAVEVALRSVGAHAELVVRDHGPGVPEDALGAIFRPFYRVGTDRDRRTGGSGVGLAITARVAERHHGAVRAANAEGGGLVVTLELPTSRAT